MAWLLFVTLCCRLQLYSSDFLMCSSSCLHRSFWLDSLSDSSSFLCLALVSCFSVAGDSTSTVWVTYWEREREDIWLESSTGHVLTNLTLRSDLPSPLAPCLSLCPTPAAAPSLGPLVSSAPLLSSTRFVRSVAPDVKADQHAAVGTSPAAALCCGGFHSPSRAHKKTMSILKCVFAVTWVARQWALRCAGASHLDEHGAGLGRDGWQLLQEALGDAQVLLQTLVLCWQTQNPLLRVCGPLRTWNMRFSITMRMHQCNFKMLFFSYMYISLEMRVSSSWIYIKGVIQGMLTVVWLFYSITFHSVRVWADVAALLMAWKVTKT